MSEYERSFALHCFKVIYNKPSQFLLHETSLLRKFFFLFSFFLALESYSSLAGVYLRSYTSPNSRQMLVEERSLVLSNCHGRSRLKIVSTHYCSEEDTARPSEELRTTYEAANDTVLRHLLLYCERLRYRYQWKYKGLADFRVTAKYSLICQQSITAKANKNQGKKEIKGFISSFN